MGEVINLNRARKARERAAREEEAVSNRARFGRSKAERAEEETRRDQGVRRLDGHKLGEDDPEPPKAG